MKHPIKTVPLGLTLLALFTGPPTQARAQQMLQAQLQRTGSIENRRMREASGVAASRAYPGVLWTHNDSGDGPFIYAMTAEGTLLAVFDVRGARARDWEDIALGPCPGRDSGECLYLADTGDNGRNRDHVSIYYVPEPNPGAGTTRGNIQTQRSHRIRFKYQGGDSWDVEALAVAPNGDITLVSKGRRAGEGIVEFRIPAESVGDEDPRAVRIGQLPITPVRHLGRWVTGASISPDGEQLVIRTYTELYFFSRELDGTLSTEPTICWLGAREPQGEAVDFLDENTVVLVSESVMNRPGTIFSATCTEQ